MWGIQLSFVFSYIGVPRYGIGYRLLQVEVERMRAKAQDILINKLAAVRRKAEEKLAAAEVKRNCHAAKTEQKAEYIRKTGRFPSSFSCHCWCF